MTLRSPNVAVDLDDAAGPTHDQRAHAPLHLEQHPDLVRIRRESDLSAERTWANLDCAVSKITTLYYY